MVRSLTDPRLRSSMGNHWPSLCTIQEKMLTNSVAGQPMETGDVNYYQGMVNVPCRTSRYKGNERRDAGVESKFRKSICRLNGYFTIVVSRTMRAVVDGVVWQIRGIEYDSQHF